MAKTRNEQDPVLLGAVAAGVLLLGFALGYLVSNGQGEIEGLKARLKSSEQDKDILVAQARKEGTDRAKAMVDAERARYAARLVCKGRSSLPPPVPLTRTFTCRAGDRIHYAWKTITPAGRTSGDGIGIAIKRADGLAGMDVETTTDKKPADTGVFEVPRDGEWIVTVRNLNVLDVFDLDYDFSLEPKEGN